jgi:hypothetical protein
MRRKIPNVCDFLQPTETNSNIRPLHPPCIFHCQHILLEWLVSDVDFHPSLEQASEISRACCTVKVTTCTANSRSSAGLRKVTLIAQDNCCGRLLAEHVFSCIPYLARCMLMYFQSFQNCQCLRTLLQF